MGKTVRKTHTNTSKRATPANRENSPPLLDRLIGIETEFAIVHLGSPPKAPFDFYRFIGSVKKSVPAAPSLRNDYRFFLANGGSFCLENGSSPDFRRALLESATPECTSPLQLLESQWGIRNLAVSAIADCYPGGNVCLVQGNHDGHGHTYGQHESYDVNVASGASLLGWRMGILFLLPWVLTYRLIAALWILLIVALARTEGALRWMVQGGWFRRSDSRSAPHSAPEVPYIASRWLVLCAQGLRFFHGPLAWLLWCNIQLFALRPYRRQLGAFFASRCILDGCGFVDSAGNFSVSARAEQVNCMIGFGGYGKSRPVFRCDNWLRQLCFGSPFSIKSFWTLLKQKQRVEIAIGDSGVCQVSQYVRIGSTALVLDLIDRNPTTVLPRLKAPIRSMHRFAKDWMLLAKECDTSDSHWQASEIQNAYASQVRNMLEQSSDVPSEAWKILHHWQSTLNYLDLSDDSSSPSNELVGRIDWITKLWLFDQLEKPASIEARKKLDLRYHELSDEGYGLKVQSMIGSPAIARPERIQRAISNPPDCTAPQQRSYYIREFAGESSKLAMDWNEIRVSVEGKWKTIRLQS
ncbi:proteasome accessory factor PafA2 family protein [Pirellulaceae bacterium SH501]